MSEMKKAARGLETETSEAGDEQDRARRINQEELKVGNETDRPAQNQIKENRPMARTGGAHSSQTQNTNRIRTSKTRQWEKLDSKANPNSGRQQKNKTHNGLTLQVKNPNKNSRSDARTRGTPQNAKPSFSLHSKQDYTESTNVTVLPPSFD
jgi:hypothetical protein